MRFEKPAASSLASSVTSGAFAADQKRVRVLACNMNALTKEQRVSHSAATKQLLEYASQEEVEGGYVFSVDRARMTVAQLAEWVANESRCCPAVDFALDLPAFGPLTLRLEGGADVKEFIAAELGL